MLFVVQLAQETIWSEGSGQFTPGTTVATPLALGRRREDDLFRTGFEVLLQLLFFVHQARAV